MSTHNPDSPTPRRPALRWPKALVLMAAGLCFALPTVWPATVEAQITCARCYDLTIEGEEEHYATYNFPVLEGWHGNPDEEGADEEWGTHFDNLPGTCKENHDKCVGGEQFVVEAITHETMDAVARGDIGLLAHLVTSVRVYLVPERSAVQVLGCGSTIAAHLPISRRLLSALESVVAEQDFS